MKGFYEKTSIILIGFIIIISVIFALLQLGLLETIEKGVDTGEITELNDNWICVIDGDENESFETTLPTTLPLPENTNEIVLINNLPENIKRGDVLRLHTLLGWYDIYIDGELRSHSGNKNFTEKFILENGSNLLLVPLDEGDSGAEIIIETGYNDESYLAQQNSPTVSDHRDLLMNDFIGSSSMMTLIIILGILALVLVFLWVFFLYKKQSKHFLLGNGIFIILGLIYYNSANMLFAEIYGYPKDFPMYNDFLYYLLEFALPIVAYHLVLIQNEKPISIYLRMFILIHTIFVCIAMMRQMLWIANIDILERTGSIFTIIGFIWLWIEIKPLKLPKLNLKLIIPVYLCVIGLLLDYYKLTGTWWPMPNSWVVFLQAELPFMFFFSISLVILTIMVFWIFVEFLVEEQVTYKKNIEMALFQTELAQHEYNITIEKFSQISKIKHDMKYHFTTINALAINNENDEIAKYTSNLFKEIDSNEVNSNNFITESFLGHYRQLCEKKNISFISEISYNEKSVTNKTNIGILLGNALQNAYEAASDSKIVNPYIAIKGKRQGNQIIFKIENSYIGLINDDFKSTKGRNRGIGLSSIRGITEKENGYVEITYTDTVFTLNAVLIVE